GRTPRQGVIFTLDERTDRYLTDALTAHPADATVKGMTGSFVRTWVEKATPLPNGYGRVRRTRGVSLCGATLQSPGDALYTEWARKHVLLPLIAFALAVVSLIGFAAQPSVRFSTTSMFKQFLPGLCLLIGLCLLSAVLQTSHILEAERVMAGPPAPKA